MKPEMIGLIQVITQISYVANGFSIQDSTNKVFEYGGSQIGSTHSVGMIYVFFNRC